MSGGTSAEGLRVERCPACGARYNVTRLEPGTRFSCRRCAGVVTVTAGGTSGGAEWSASSSAGGGPSYARPGGRASLFMAGLVLLVGAALRAVPGAFEGEKGAAWWSAATALPLPDAVALALAAATGLVALLAAPARAARGLPIAVAVAGIVLFLRSHGPETPVLSIAPPDPAGAAAVILLGCGALALAARRDGSRGAARPLVVTGALVLIAAAAMQFAAGGERSTTASEPPSAAADATSPPTAADALIRSPKGFERDQHTSQILARWQSMRALADAVWRGEPIPTTRDPWDGPIKDGLIVLAAGLMTLAVLLPGRSGGAISRWTGRASALLLLLSFLAAPLASLWASRDAWPGDGGIARVAKDAASAVFDRGLGVWLVLAAAGAALATPHSLPFSATPRVRARSGFLYFVTALVAAGAVALLANPTTGSAVRSLPWAVLRDLSHDARLAEPRVVLVLASLLAAVATLLWLVAPLRGRGGLMAAVAAAAACTTHLAVATAGVPRFAFPALVAIAAGATLARRGARWDGRGRTAAAGAAAVIVLLLAFPSGEWGAVGATGPSSQAESDTSRFLGPYPCAATTVAAAVSDVASGSRRALDLLADSSLVPTTLAAIGAVIALLGVLLGPRRPLAWLLAIGAAAAALYEPAYAFAMQLDHPAPGAFATPLLAALAAAGTALARTPTASLFGALCASSDAAGGRA